MRDVGLGSRRRSRERRAPPRRRFARSPKPVGPVSMPSDDRTRGPRPRHPRPTGSARPGPGTKAAGAALTAPELSVVVPLKDEQENLAELRLRLARTLEAMGRPYEVVFVDDGSRDATPRLLDAFYDEDPHVVVVRLSRNFGHQAAISAGLERARGRAVMVMDGDLQDPPEVIPLFVESWREGNDVVYAVRRGHKENAFKRLGYFSFYRVLRAIGDIDIPLDSGDFCLMDRRVVDVLCG